MALKLRNMEDDKRNDFLTELARYCDELGVWDQGDIFGHQPRTPQPQGAGVELGDLSPYRLGQLAAAAASDASANAFPPGTEENEEWRDGWTAEWSARRGQPAAAAPLSAEPEEPKRRGRPRKTGEMVH